MIESNVVEEARVTRKAKRAQPTVTKMALSKTFNEFRS
jgi:hypothetical protein